MCAPERLPFARGPTFSRMRKNDIRMWPWARAASLRFVGTPVATEPSSFRSFSQAISGFAGTDRWTGPIGLRSSSGVSARLAEMRAFQKRRQFQNLEKQHSCDTCHRLLHSVALAVVSLPNRQQRAFKFVCCLTAAVAGDKVHRTLRLTFTAASVGEVGVAPVEAG